MSFFLRLLFRAIYFTTVLPKVQNSLLKWGGKDCRSYRQPINKERESSRHNRAAALMNTRDYDKPFIQAQVRPNTHGKGDEN